jgi:hypothetical protein
MGNWRVFLAGMFCGTVLQMAIIGGVWWKSAYGHTEQEDWIVVRSDEDEELYDRCLADSGNIVACDATMRLLDRYRAAENAEMTAIKPEVTKMLTAGVSRCAVAKWGYERGLVGSQVARALYDAQSLSFARTSPCELQHAVTIVAHRALQCFMDRFLQRRELKRFADNRGAQTHCLHDLIVSSRE